MRIGGSQDILSMDIAGVVTPYVLFNGQLEALRYHSQNRHYLGDGLGVHGFLNHKFWLGYPDFSLGFFTDLYFLRRNGTLGGDVLRLFPPLSPEVLSDPVLLAGAINFEYEQLIPPSYYQAGFQFSFGDNIREYTSRLRPYFNGRLYYNTLTKISYNVSGGLSTAVFGRDSLIVYAEHGTAPAVADATTSMLGARYMVYF